MRCLVIDDEEYDRAVLARVICRAGHEAVCAADVRTAVELVKREPFDVALVDLRMPGVNGIHALRLLRQAAPFLRMLVVSAFDDRAHVIAAVAAGAAGYLVKSDLVSLPQALADLGEGGGPMSRNITRYLIEELRESPGEPLAERALSPRQMDIVVGVAQGNSYKEIAVALRISENTVRHHVRLISRKLSVKGAKEAARRLAISGGKNSPGFPPSS